MYQVSLLSLPPPLNTALAPSLISTHETTGVVEDSLYCCFVRPEQHPRLSFPLVQCPSLPLRRPLAPFRCLYLATLRAPTSLPRPSPRPSFQFQASAPGLSWQTSRGSSSSACHLTSPAEPDQGIAPAPTPRLATRILPSVSVHRYIRLLLIPARLDSPGLALPRFAV